MGRDAAFIAVGSGGPVNKSMALPLSAQDQATVDARCKTSQRVSVSWQFAPAGGASISPGGGQCQWGPCTEVATLDVLDDWLIHHPGDAWFAGQISSNTLFLLADVLHYSWASTDPGATAYDAGSLISDALIYVTGKDFNFQNITPQDLGLAIAYLGYKAVPGRTGDAQAQGLMMAAITSAASTFRARAAQRGMPGF